MNTAETIKQKLRAMAAKQADARTDELIRQYVIRGFLARLQHSRYAQNFILKGAIMYLTWPMETRRMTHDIDFKGDGISNSVESLRNCIEAIMTTPLPAEDALRFDPDSLRIMDILHDGDYQGRRVKMTVYLGRSRTMLQLDIGFNDPIVPEAQAVIIPGMLEIEDIELLGYTMESLAAEKIHAIATIGETNSRIKDFFDVTIFLRQMKDRELLLRAIRTTFEHRETAFPPSFAHLTPEYAAGWQQHWLAFLQLTENAEISSDFATVACELRAKLEALFSGE